MAENRPQLGALIATIGAALLAVSVFLPWYALSLTASGAASAQQGLNNLAQQYGNTAFQSQARTVGAGFSALAGQPVATLSAHQALKYLSVLLLILAAIAFVAALLSLVGAAPSQTGGGQIALVGLVAALCVLYRIVAPPVSEEGVLAVSLSWGSWLALGSSLAIIAGGLRPHRVGSAKPSTAELEKAWAGLSGWTPGA